MNTEVNIIIVDDDKNILEVCHNYLIDEYKNITCASDSKVALNLFDSTRIDIAIVDITMPEVNGFEFMEIASKKNPQCQFILITGYATIANLHRAIRFGVFDFLEKPFSQTTFLEKVGEAVDEVANLKNLHYNVLHAEKLEQNSVSSKNQLVELLSGVINTWAAHIPTQINEDFVADKKILDQLYADLLFLFDDKISNSKKDKYHALTPTEKKVAQMLEIGMSPFEISKKMSRSVLTVYVHIKRIKHKYGIIKPS